MRGRTEEAGGRGGRRRRNFPFIVEDPVLAWWRGADLEADRRHLPRLFARHPHRERPAAQDRFEKPVERRRSRVDHRQRKDAGGEAGAGSRQGDAVGDVARKRPLGGDRKSTTSELQSLMRISYAVFCLKKKNPGNETLRQS